MVCYGEWIIYWLMDRRAWEFLVFFLSKNFVSLPVPYSEIKRKQVLPCCDLLYRATRPQAESLLPGEIKETNWATFCLTPDSCSLVETGIVFIPWGHWRLMIFEPDISFLDQTRDVPGQRSQLGSKEVYSLDFSQS